MRRILTIFAVLLLVAGLVVTAFASTGVTKMDSVATVSADGSCQVTMTVTVRLEQQMDKLYFPIPAEASGVTLNGTRVSAPRSNGVRRVNITRLTKNVVGEVSFHIHYSLYDVIHTTEAGMLEMQIPLLSGFGYPVENMTFSVTLPDQIDVLPGFVSGYHQARIEEHLTYEVQGMTIQGGSLKALKDHETLTMTLPVTEQMFPQTIAQTQDYQFSLTVMGIFGAVALLYWLITMLNLPVWPQRSTEPPEGYTAGQIGCIAAGRGVDLSLTVMSWAQLGYVLIKTERSGRVLLYKRMDMGNERSEAERRLFVKLFGKRDMVDATSYHYGTLCRAAAKKTAGMGELLRRFTGNPMIFRGLASGIGLFGGIGLAVALADGAALQGVLVVLMGAAGAFSGWLIQDIGSAIILPNLRKATPALTLCGAWLLLGLMCSASDVSLVMILGTVTAGLLLAWGGRRTEMGRVTLAKTMGLRRYLVKADKTQLRHICDADPDYFFRLAPYALALGADRAFAKQFGNQKLNGCPYLTSGMDAHMTAQQWAEVLRKALADMDARADRLPLEKLIRMVRAITRG